MMSWYPLSRSPLTLETPAAMMSTLAFAGRMGGSRR